MGACSAERSLSAKGRFTASWLDFSAWWDGSKGLVFVVLSELFGALMNAIARLLEDKKADSAIHPLQIIFFRMSITCILSSVYMWYTNVSDFPLGTKAARWLLILRGFAGFIGVFTIYYALVYIPIADVTMIGFLVPPVTLWAGSIFLGEKFTKREAFAVIASFVGIIVIARPLSVFKPTEFMCGDLHNMHHHGTTSVPVERLWAVLIGMLGVFGGACSFTIIRHVGTKVHPLLSVNYYAFVSAVISLIALIAVPGVSFRLPSDMREWLLLLSMGICGFLLQLGFTAGLQQAKSNAATLMMYTEIVFSLGLDKILWGNSPDRFSIAGGAIVIGSSIFAAIRKDSIDPIRHTDEEQQLIAGDEKLLEERED